MGTICAVRQTNMIKMVHNWINNGEQQGIFSQGAELIRYPAECGKVEYHQHYLSCYSPLMLVQKNKYIRQMYKTFKATKTAISIARALKYIIRSVMSETESFQRHFSNSSSISDIKLYQIWQKQKIIGWIQIFKGRISVK